MMCVCQKAFCWNCLKPYNTDSWVHRCPVVINKTKVAPLQSAWVHHVETEPTKTKAKSRSYLRSVEHRKGHHPRAATILCQKAAVLARLMRSPKVSQSQSNVQADFKVKLATQRSDSKEVYKLVMSVGDLITQVCIKQPIQ